MNLAEQVAHYRQIKNRISMATPKAPPVVTAVHEERDTIYEPENVIRRIPANVPVRAKTRESLGYMLAAYDLTWKEIVSPCRKQKLVVPRRAIIWCLHCAGLSSTQIGRVLNRDHSSIIYALKEINLWDHTKSSKKLHRLSKIAASTTAGSNRTLSEQQQSQA